jgi:hypothetical protein
VRESLQPTEEATRVRIASDPARTAERREQLESYFDDNLLTRDGSHFVCAHADRCKQASGRRPFEEGNLPHLGNHYDLVINGRESRIAVIGMEAFGSGRITMSERYKQIIAVGDKQFDGGSDPSQYRNPHMRGTTLALRSLVGIGTESTDISTEMLSSDVHLLDAFALLNARSCAALHGDGKRSRNLSTLTRNCLGHLLETLRVLEPNVAVIQGHSKVRGILEPAFEHTVGLGVGGEVSVATIPGCRARTVFVWLHHPSGSRYGWSSPRHKYFGERVLPALEAARRFVHTP